MALVKTNENGGRKTPAIRTSFDDLFDIDKFFNAPFPGASEWSNWRGNVPATNIKETETSYEVELAAPGLRKEDFYVSVENGGLDIKVEKEEEKSTEKDNYTRKEYSYTNFHRTFLLPETVKAELIEAKYENGVLRIQLPKDAVALKDNRKKIAVG